MTGVLTGFAVIAAVITVGYLLARFGVVSMGERIVLNRVAFHAASPALLFTVLSQADVHVVFTGLLATHALTTVLLIVVVFVVLGAWGSGASRDPASRLVHAYDAAYVNSNNIGLPVAVYVIGQGGYVAPVLFLQLIVLGPLLMGALDVLTAGSARWGKALLKPFTNPIVFASVAGALVSVLGWEVPEAVMLPLELLGGAAVPLMLIAFGVSLKGQRPLQAGSGRRDILVAVLVKAVGMPVVAWCVATFLFGLDPELTYAAVVLAALPTAQNMYQYALQYDRGEVVTRDVILLTTVLSLPVMLGVALVLHP